MFSFRCLSILVLVKIRTVLCAEQVIMEFFVVVVVVAGEFLVKTSNG